MDTDGDGIPDEQDPDIDGDGVLNEDDAFPSDGDESSDLDGDGIGDNADQDRDGDGYANSVEVEFESDPNNAGSTPPDLDGDFIPDQIDGDRDGDGVANEQDAFPDNASESSDIDGDGVGDNADPDRDGDGYNNDVEETFNTDPNDADSRPADLDGDFIPDAIDEDRDGDGVNNDLDAFPDDASETNDLDGDGIGDNADLDRDGDGISNEFEEILGTDPNNALDRPSDLDGDGVPDALDTDIDGDGVINTDDAFPLDPSERSDLDGDGIGDNADPDRDGDGFSNEQEATYATDPNDASSTPPDLDGDLIPDDIDDDRDGDGVDNTDDVFPDDSSESADLDGDGIGDNTDTDRDGDGFDNDQEAEYNTDPDNADDTPPDLDGDLIPDDIDDDRDGDGTENEQDAFPDDPQESGDLDNDGIGDNADTDRDGDGFSNELEATYATDPDDATSTPPDLDGDLIPDDIDDDRDGDGVDNTEDVFPDDGSESSDLDGDGIGDNTDPDRDGDGFDNNQEAEYNTDPDNAGDTPPDLDGDFIPDDIDDDRDGDGTANEQDAFPNDPQESSDLDNDGIGDNADEDRDGDTISNVFEEQLGTDPNDPNDTPSDIDGDAVPDALDDDIDGDGIENIDDVFPNDPTESRDLDGDGIGDNADSDRDGDNFSNETEETRGTDPNDAADFPDDVAPLLVLDNAEPQTLEASSVIINGLASDPAGPRTGLSTVSVTSDQFSNNQFTGIVDTNTGRFSIEVPLRVMLNTLTITAQDLSGNQSQASIEVDRVSPPRFANVQPVNGSTSAQEEITISGEIRTFLPLESLTFFINETQSTPISTTQDGVYRFDFPNTPLVLGQNQFSLTIQSDDGNDQQVIQINHVPEGADEIPAPTMTLLSPAAGALLNQDSFQVAVQIESSAGPLTVSLNGQLIVSAEQGLTFYNLSELVAFEDGQDSTTVTVSAEDTLDRVTTNTYTFFRDASAPTIILDEPLGLSPLINPVSGSPYRLQGSIDDENLANVLIDGQGVNLTPGASENSFRFDVALPLGIGEERPFSISAVDRSGNQTEVEYILRNVATASIDILSPATNTEFVATDQDLRVQIVARLDGITGSENVVATVNGGTPVTLTINGSLASGNVTLPPTTADYLIALELSNTSGASLAQANTTIRVNNQQDIEVEVLRVEPENNAQFIEPNAPIEVYFSRQIDPQLLQVLVTETLHGQTYINQDELGEDFIKAQGFVLTAVNKDLAPVNGQINVMPGNAGAVFVADDFYGYNADLFIDVAYNDESISRTRFKVRELPTFINGAVVDQFGQPLSNIQVDLPELGRTTTTNGDGGFAFGYQESGDQVIPEGRYQLVINPDLVNPRFGTSIKRFNIQRNRANNVDRIALQELDRSISFFNINSGQNNNLIGGDLQLDLRNARVLFNAGRTSGGIHVQFLPFEHLGVETYNGASPHWLFGIQPKGVNLEGDPQISFQIPMLRNSRDYINSDLFKYVILLGYSAEGDVVEPVGVGRIDGQRVVSVGSVHLTSLDFLGYAIVAPTLNGTLEQFSIGEISLQQLKARLQAQQAVAQ